MNIYNKYVHYNVLIIKWKKPSLITRFRLQTGQIIYQLKIIYIDKIANGLENSWEVWGLSLDKYLCGVHMAVESP